MVGLGLCMKVLILVATTSIKVCLNHTAMQIIASISSRQTEASGRSFVVFFFVRFRENFSNCYARK